MNSQKKYYLFHIQFFGYRYHGWSWQPGLKTVQSQIDKTFAHIFGHSDFKTLASSRTDSKVSANHFIFELFSREVFNPDFFLNVFNSNLPNDIRALKIEEVDAAFNVIHAPKMKEYLYFFSSGQKPHPFSAGLVMSFRDPLDVELMKAGAKSFEGRHDFRRYCARKRSPNDNSDPADQERNFIRNIAHCGIEKNEMYSANFYPPDTYFLRIKSAGFMRYQVRLMMGQLLSLGRHETTLDDLFDTLKGDIDTPVKYIAPSSGLVLNKIILE
jgi:tRNA pseudouridine38-40 synthase